MPCTSDWGNGPGRYGNPETRRRLDAATRVACSTLRTLSKEAISRLSKETQVWWAKHQEQDRQRLAAEAARRQRESDRKAALAKLTTKERKALGL